MVDILSVLSTVGYYAVRVFICYASLVLVIPLASVYQEYLIWSRSDAIPSLNLRGYLKVYLLNVAWMACTLVGAIILFPLWLLGGNVEDAAHEWVEGFTSKVCVLCFVGPVEVRGAENLPPYVTTAPAPVYIANHSSQIDAGAVYFLERKFKWIAKRSVLYLPGVGQIMYMAQHVFINRKKGKNKKSVSNLYEKSNEAIQSGCPMFIFPQGTRRLSERLPFKDGAFNIAMANKSDLICVSVEIPLTAWNDWYPLSLLWGAKTEPVVLTVHKAIPVSGTEDKEALKKQCFDTIYSVLPQIGDEQATEEDKKKQ